jgi:hypothetical protein
MPSLDSRRAAAEDADMWLRVGAAKGCATRACVRTARQPCSSAQTARNRACGRDASGVRDTPRRGGWHRNARCHVRAAVCRSRRLSGRPACERASGWVHERQSGTAPPEAEIGATSAWRRPAGLCLRGSRSPRTVRRSGGYKTVRRSARRLSSLRLAARAGVQRVRRLDATRTRNTALKLGLRAACAALALCRARPARANA